MNLGIEETLPSSASSREENQKQMATASSSVPSSSSSATAESQNDLLKEIRSHEIALAELDSLSSSKAVYQRNENIFFRTTIQKAKASEQKELDSANVKLKRLNGF